MALLLRNPNVYYGNGYRKRRVGRPRLRKRGKGFFSSIGNALSKAHDFIKSNKLVSTVGNALGSVGVPYAGAIGKAAGVLGYGKRRLRARPRVVRRRRVGGLNLRSLLSSGHALVKKHGLASKLASHLGHPKLASAISSLGYGRRRVRRRRVVRRRHVGGLNLRSLLSSGHALVKKHGLASKLASHLGHPKLASAISSLGYGRRRTVRRRVVRRRAPVRRHRGGANFFSTSQIAAPKF